MNISYFFNIKHKLPSWSLLQSLVVCLQRSSTMEELDVPQMKREVESLQYQLAINREKSSITVTE